MPYKTDQSETLSGCLNWSAHDEFISIKLARYYQKLLLCFVWILELWKNGREWNGSKITFQSGISKWANMISWYFLFLLPSQIHSVLYRETRALFSKVFPNLCSFTTFQGFSRSFSRIYPSCIILLFLFYLRFLFNFVADFPSSPSLRIMYPASSLLAWYPLSMTWRFPLWGDIDVCVWCKSSHVLLISPAWRAFKSLTGQFQSIDQTLYLFICFFFHFQGTSGTGSSREGNGGNWVVSLSLTYLPSSSEQALSIRRS